MKQRPPLDNRKKNLRKNFAVRILQRAASESDLASRFVFSDEKLFRGYPSNDREFVRRERGSDEWIESDMRSKPNNQATCMIWLTIDADGKGPLSLAENRKLWTPNGEQIRPRPPPEEILKSGFDNESYVAMLKEALPEIKSRVANLILVQDNARVHTALKNEGNTVYDLFEREQVEFVSDWPPNSPDLHPVENAHRLLQVEVNKLLDSRTRLPKNKRELLALIRGAWENVDSEKVKNCHGAFLDRLRLCLIKGGGNNFHTKMTKLNRQLLSSFELVRFLP